MRPQSNTVRALVMGKGNGRPPYNYELDDDWEPPPAEVPAEEVPDFVATYKAHEAERLHQMSLREAVEALRKGPI